MYARVSAIYSIAPWDIADRLTEPMLLNLASNANYVSEQISAPIVQGFADVMSAVLESFGGKKR